MSTYFKRKGSPFRSDMAGLGEDCSTWTAKLQADQGWYDGLSPSKQAKNSGVLSTIAADKENYNACMARNTAALVTQISAPSVGGPGPTPVNPGIIGTIGNILTGGPTPTRNPQAQPSGGIPTWVYLAGGAALIGVAFWMYKKRKK